MSSVIYKTSSVISFKSDVRSALRRQSSTGGGFLNVLFFVNIGFAN